MKFWQHLKELRGYNTQEQLAELMPEGFSVRTLQSWENEHRTPPDWIQKLVISHLQSEIESKPGW